MGTKIMHGPGVQIELDESQVFPEDPGQGTPALVKIGAKTGTFWCVLETGEIGCDTPVSMAHQRWLARQEEAVTEWLNAVVAAKAGAA